MKTGRLQGAQGQPVRFRDHEDQRCLRGIPQALPFRSERPDAFEGRAVVFEGPEDYHHRIDDPSLKIDECTLLFMRGAGPIRFRLRRGREHAATGGLIRGITSLPCIGDGRQSGTSGSPSILNASPEAAAGADLPCSNRRSRTHRPPQGTADILVSPAEL